MKILLILMILSTSCTSDIERSGSLSTPNSNVIKEDKQKKTERNIVRLSPKEFTDLPKEIISDLEKRECTIPQSYGLKEKHNVIKGEFKQKEQIDIAVLCSKNKSSTILVYWNKSIEDLAEVAKQDDDDFMQGNGDGGKEYSRGIGIVGEKYINEHYENYGGAKPPKITHQAINDIFAEKASTVRYFDGKEWLELQGAD